MSNQYPAKRLDPRRTAVQQAHRTSGIAAGFHLAAIGVEYPHPEICQRAGFKQDQLIAADPGLAISQRGGQLCGDRRHARHAGIEHDKIVTEAVHLDEGNVHGRALGAVREGVQYCN